MRESSRTVLMTQRVIVDSATGERRDGLDQRWPRFLHSVGLTGVAVPNILELIDDLFEKFKPIGVLLTGGNDLGSVGGDAKDRDAVEDRIVEFARSQRLPLLGVCRGMQVIQQSFGIRLQPVEGHVKARQTINVLGSPQTVNSYHRFGTCESVDTLAVCARSEDGVIKMVRAVDEPILGIMWHPERCVPIRAEDDALFRDFFRAAQ